MHKEAIFDCCGQPKCAVKWTLGLEPSLYISCWDYKPKKSKTARKNAQGVPKKGIIDHFMHMEVIIDCCDQPKCAVEWTVGLEPSLYISCYDYKPKKSKTSRKNGQGFPKKRFLTILCIWRQYWIAVTSQSVRLSGLYILNHPYAFVVGTTSKICPKHPEKMQRVPE